jgi:hypothetical protein
MTTLLAGSDSAHAGTGASAGTSINDIVPSDITVFDNKRREFAALVFRLLSSSRAFEQLLDFCRSVN